MDVGAQRSLLRTLNVEVTGAAGLYRAAVRVDGRVGRSRYAEESSAAAARIILHLHPLNPEGMILQYFVRINQHDDATHRRAL